MEAASTAILGFLKSPANKIIAIKHQYSKLQESREEK